MLEDVKQLPSIRVAAAIALAARDQGDTRTRLRVVAEATVEPTLRAALEVAADPERDAEMQALLDELEAE
ncbi:hypothetical protein WME91_03335 [Sorangium sp. So ce269]